MDTLWFPGTLRLRLKVPAVGWNKMGICESHDIRKTSVNPESLNIFIVYIYIPFHIITIINLIIITIMIVTIVITSTNTLPLYYI